MRVDATFQLRRDVAADWALKNPILLEGEPGYEIDTGLLKVGDGRTRWLNLLAFHPGQKVDGTSDAAVWAHINSLTPHPAYDDGPSLILLYENAKV